MTYRRKEYNQWLLLRYWVEQPENDGLLSNGEIFGGGGIRINGMIILN